MNRRDFLLASVAAMAAAGTLRAAPGASVSATRRVRVACFSKTGNTRAVADLIAQALGADVAEIRPAVPYPADYQAAVDRSRAELESGETVAIAPVALGDFDVLFVGSPNWWGTVAPPAATFLRTAPLKGKLVVPFFTHGGGGIQRCGLDASRILEARGAPAPRPNLPQRRGHPPNGRRLAGHARPRRRPARLRGRPARPLPPRPAERRQRRPLLRPLVGRPPHRHGRAQLPHRQRHLRARLP